MNIVFHHFENPPEKEKYMKRRDEHTIAKVFRLSIFIFNRSISNEIKLMISNVY